MNDGVVEGCAGGALLARLGDVFEEVPEVAAVVLEEALLAAGGVGEQAERVGAFTALGEVLDALEDAVFENFDVVLCQGEY